MLPTKGLLVMFAAITNLHDLHVCVQGVYNFGPCQGIIWISVRGMLDHHTFKSVLHWV